MNLKVRGGAAMTYGAKRGASEGWGCSWQPEGL